MSDLEKKSAESGGGAEDGALAIREEFDRRWYRQLGISGFTALMIIPMTLLEGTASELPTWGYFAVLGGVLVALFGSWKNWRCPACDSYFGKRFMGLRHCASCGVKLTA